MPLDRSAKTEFYTKLYSWILSRFNIRNDHIEKRKQRYKCFEDKSSQQKQHVFFLRASYFTFIFKLGMPKLVYPTNTHKMLYKLPQLVKTQNYQKTCSIKLTVSSSSEISVTPA